VIADSNRRAGLNVRLDVHWFLPSFVLVQTHAKAVCLVNGRSAGRMVKKKEEILQEQ
jgi:hypothetical protein